MGRQFSLPAIIPPRRGLKPAADAAGRTSAYLSLKGAVKAYIVCYVDQGNAAQVTFTPLQASAVAGTGSKAITATPIWAAQDVATADALVAQTAAANFQTSAAVKEKFVVFEIVPEQCMDVANGFDCIAIQTSASNASNITSATIFVLESYQQATPPARNAD
jgi:hypothetical protein